MIAKDYKAPPQWHPEQSANGARAAVLAAKDGGKVDIWQPEPSAWGNSAASQAMKTDRNGTLSPKIDYGYTALGRQGSMMAATGAMSGSRKRSESTPVPRIPTYPDEANATANALSAATHANLKKPKSEIPTDAGASPFTNMPREMFTSHPPVKPEVDEKNRADTIHASAVAMAKQIYNQQQKQFEQAAANVKRSDSHYAANSAIGRRPSTSMTADEPQPMRFNYLQEAAQKLAQERLAKLHDEHAQNREYRDYYSESTPKTSRLSLRGRPRRRASSDGASIDDDMEAQKIRNQMSLFTSNLSKVDAKKRQMDRDALMAAAQRNVTARLSGMDQKIFNESGKVGPSLLSEWEIKAHTAAQRDSDKRMENYGKVNIGGGKFINQSAVDLVAQRNVQPVLDEINEKAAELRARDAELKLEEERKKREAAEKKIREKEIKDVNKKLKGTINILIPAKLLGDFLTSIIEQDKEEERLKKAEEKAAKEEQKRLANKEKHKNQTAASTAVLTSDATATATPAGTEDKAEGDETLPVETPRAPDRHPVGYTAPTDLRTSMELQQQERLEEISNVKPESSPTKGVKGWFGKLRRKSKSQKSDAKDIGGEKFVGGAALTGAGSTASIEPHSSTKETPAAKEMPAPEAAKEAVVDKEERVGRSSRRASSVSSLSAPSAQDGLVTQSSHEEEFQEAQDHFDDSLAPPTTTSKKSTSPARTSQFTEVI